MRSLITFMWLFYVCVEMTSFRRGKDGFLIRGEFDPVGREEEISGLNQGPVFARCADLDRRGSVQPMGLNRLRRLLAPARVCSLTDRHNSIASLTCEVTRTEAFEDLGLQSQSYFPRMTINRA